MIHDDRTPVIVGAARTPIGSFGGSLSSVSAVKLGSIAIAGALKRASIDPKNVQACYMGNVCSAGIGQAPARQAALGAGLPESCVTATVNKVCSSGLKAISLAAQDIQLGHADVAVAGGMESMSQVPYYLPSARFGLRMGDSNVVDGVVHDGLTDPFSSKHMGLHAETCARAHSFDRGAQDAHAAQSYRRALAAWQSGLFDAEVEPVPTEAVRGRRSSSSSSGNGNGNSNGNGSGSGGSSSGSHGSGGGGGGSEKVAVVERDDECFRTDPNGLGALRPAFIKDGSGTVTRGNASALSDGAAAVVVMSARRARELGLKPLARVCGYADAERTPAEFTVAPAAAVPAALRRAGLRVADVDAFEINEAFSVVALANQHLLKLAPERVNLWGGAVSLGHPIGCSGARIVVTLLSVLEHSGWRRGVAALCNGGGGASAIVLDRGVDATSSNL